MRYFILTFGCQMNYSDSERIASVLEKIGYKKSQKPEMADLILINMCSVRQMAVDRVYGKINDFIKLKNKNRKIKIVITGCILKSDKQKLKEKVDLILDIKDLEKLPKMLGSWYSIPKEENYLRIKPKYQSVFSAPVPIMTGCNNFCSYCAVPYTKGREISRPSEEILLEIRNLIKKNYKEIWLLGQNVNSYHSPISTNVATNDTNRHSRKLVPKLVNIRDINFPKLLKVVNDIPGKFWIRFTSPHPKDFSDELINAVAESEKVTPYLNLPVQSGDDGILKKMNRPYNITHYKNLVKKIRKKIPDITLTTDVIVGFPGETKKQFKNTAKLFKEIKYDMAYIARYSPRPGTAASKLKDNVSFKEKEKRRLILNEILKKTALEKNKKYIGKKVDVLSGNYKNGFLIGKTKHYKTIKFKGEKKLIGRFSKVKVTDAFAWRLEGCLL